MKKQIEHLLKLASVLIFLWCIFWIFIWEMGTWNKNLSEALAIAPHNTVGLVLGPVLFYFAGKISQLLTKGRKGKGKEKEGREPRFKAPEEELTQLRVKLWRTRGRNSRAAGTVLSIISGFFLSLAYVTRYVAFEVTSILALFLGVVYVLTGIERHVKLRVANRAVLSSLYTLRGLLDHFGIDESGIYIPTAEGDSVRIFLPKNRSDSLPDIGEATSSTVVLENCFILPPVGNALLQLYEEELGDIRNFDLDHLKEWLPRVLVDRLKMVEKSEITQDGEDIHVKLTASSFNELCQNREVAQICRTVGCPVSSSIAEAIAKNTGRVVYYVNCVYDPSTRITEATYKLGPTLKDLRRKENRETPQE